MKHLLYLVIVMSLFTLSAMSQSWSSLGGPQVATNVRDITLTKTGVTVFCADNSYVLKSSNSGSGWSVTSQPYASPLLVLVKPDDSTKVLAAKNDKLVYNSDGGGGSAWTEVISQSGLNPLRLVATINDNSAMLLGRVNNTSSSTDRSVWRSSNGGSSWDALTGFTSETDIYDYAAYPDGTSGHDSGLVWAAGFSNATPSPSYNPTATAEIRGLWISEDFGESWPYNKLGGYNVVSVAIVARTHPTMYHVYAAASVSGSRDTLKKLTDHTNNDWTSIFSGTDEIRLVRVNRTNSTIFLATNDGVYRSTNAYGTNGGGNWSKMTGLSENDVKSLAIGKDSTVFAGTANSLYISTDNGSTWKNVGDMNVSSVEAAQISSTQYAWAVTKDNNIAARYNGSSWERKTIGAEGASFSTEGIHRHPSTGKLFAAGALSTTASLCSSASNGSSFSAITTSFTIQSGSRYYGITTAPSVNVMYLFGGGTLTGVGWRNVFNSADSGETWNYTNVVGGNDIWVYDVVARRGDTLYAAASDGNVYHSTNSGSNWSVRVDVGTIARSVALNPAYPSVVYAGGDGGLWKTETSGSSWTQIGTITNVMKVMMHPSYQGSSDYIWVVGGAGGAKVYKTANGGTSWDSSATVATPINTLGDDGVNKGYSYLGTADGAYRINERPAAPASFTGTNVGGVPNLTWSANIESDLLSSPYRVVRYDLTCTGYCPNKQCSIVSGSLDSLPGAWTSNTYHNDTQTTVANCGMTGLVPGMVGYYAVVRDNLGQFSDPSATKEFNKGEGNIEKPHIPGEVPAEIPHDYQLFGNFPNPFNPVTTIKYALPEDVQVRLVVVDMLGRQVSVLVNEKQSAGYKSVEFDASKLASGMYLYKLVAGTFTDVKKMIVAK